MKRISEEQKELIRSMSEKKLLQREIAEAAGVSLVTVRRYQELYNIPAGNKYHGGAVSSKLRSNTYEVKKELHEEVEAQKWVMVAEKVVTLVGVQTGYMYTIGNRMDHIKITTNGGDISISLKELVAFGNEILDIADEVEKIKKNGFGI